VADENTIGGAGIGGNVGTAGGPFAGRDQTTYNNNISYRDAIDDMRTDMRLLKDDVEDLKFGHFQMRSEIASSRAVQQQRPDPPPLPSSLVDEQRRTNDLLRVLIGLLSFMALGVVLLLIVGRL